MMQIPRTTILTSGNILAVCTAMIAMDPGRALAVAPADDVSSATVLVVLLNAPSGLDATTDSASLEAQAVRLSGLAPGGTAYLEVWCQTPGPNGISAAVVDLDYDATFFSTSEGQVWLAPQWGTLPFDVTVDDTQGLINDFGGNNLSGLGVAPTWARIGTIEFDVVASPPEPVTFCSSFAGGALRFSIIAEGSLPQAEVEYGCVLVDECQYAGPPQFEQPVATAKNRYLSFTGSNAGQETAIRVAFLDLPPPHDVWNGTTMWVGEPEEISEIGGLNNETPPTFSAATLQCAPYYTDWSVRGTVHLYHEGLIPNAEYDLQAVSMTCNTADESTFSPPLMLSTTQHGDVCGGFQPGQGVSSWSAPDGSVDLTTDVLSVIDKFRSAPTAPIKARVDVEPVTPDLLINITDAIQIIDGFRGLPYPFDPEGVLCP